MLNFTAFFFQIMIVLNAPLAVVESDGASVEEEFHLEIQTPIIITEYGIRYVEPNAQGELVAHFGFTEGVVVNAQSGTLFTAVHRAFNWPPLVAAGQKPPVGL